MSDLFNTYLYQPILSVLIFIYQNVAFHDLGLAIVMLTILVRVVLFPVFWKGAKDQSLLQRLQPHIKKIQLDHKDNKEAQAKAMMALYREHRLNPFSGFALLLLQLPVFIALFRIFSKGLSAVQFDTTMLFRLINLGEKSVVVAVIAAALQYIQGKLALPPTKGNKENPLASTGKMMVIMGPALTLMILFNLPAALGLYWIVSTAFSIGQQVLINKKLPKLEDTTP